MAAAIPAPISRVTRFRSVEALSYSSALHSPAANGAVFNRAKDHVLDEKTDQDHGEEPGEHRRNLELVLVLVDEPAEAAGTRRDAEDKLRSDQRSPGKRPADLEAGENA